MNNSAVGPRITSFLSPVNGVKALHILFYLICVTQIHLGYWDFSFSGQVSAPSSSVNEGRVFVFLFFFQNCSIIELELIRLMSFRGRHKKTEFFEFVFVATDKNKSILRKCLAKVCAPKRCLV